MRDLQGCAISCNGLIIARKEPVGQRFSSPLVGSLFCLQNRKNGKPPMLVPGALSAVPQQYGLSEGLVSWIGMPGAVLSSAKLLNDGCSAKDIR